MAVEVSGEIVFVKDEFGNATKVNKDDAEALVRIFLASTKKEKNAWASAVEFISLMGLFAFTLWLFLHK